MRLSKFVCIILLFATQVEYSFLFWKIDKVGQKQEQLMKSFTRLESRVNFSEWQRIQDNKNDLDLMLDTVKTIKKISQMK